MAFSRRSLNESPRDPCCVIGVDPGTRKIGVGIVRVGSGSPELLFAKTVHLKGETLIQRLKYQFDVIESLLETYSPNVLVCEKTFLHRNVHSTLLLGQSRGILLLAAERRGCRIVEYSPTQIKKRIVGLGHASKSQVQMMTAKHLGLGRLPSEDAADALAMALCYIHG